MNAQGFHSFLAIFDNQDKFEELIYKFEVTLDKLMI